MSANDNGGRVTTREFYNALLDQKKEMVDMERRIIGGIDDIKQIQADTESRLAVGSTRFEGQDTKIEINRKNIIRVGSVNAILMTVGSYIAAKLGIEG